MKNYIIAGVVGFVALVLALLLVGVVQGRHSALGAANSNIQDSPYTFIGGAGEFTETIPFMASSSFVATIKNPFNATSSIDFISINGTNPFPTTGNALNVYVSTSTTAFGTSTPAIAIWPLVAKSQFNFVLVKNVATSSVATAGPPYGTGNPDVLAGAQWIGGGTAGGGIGQSNYILGPTQSININIATTSAGTFSSYLSGSGVTVKLRKL